MNKFNVFFAGLIVFVAVAQLALANDFGGLTNELEENTEVDDELEGGFTSKAKKIVGLSHEDEWGHDILDDDKGLSEFAKARTRECKKASNKEQCRTCCQGSDKAYQYKFKVFKSGGCTCFDRDNSYAKNI